MQLSVLTHAPAEQASFVHAMASEQKFPSSTVFEQTPPASQVSSVQGLSSLQSELNVQPASSVLDRVGTRVKSELSSVRLWAWIAMTFVPAASLPMCAVRSIVSRFAGVMLEHSWSTVATWLNAGGVPTTFRRTTSWPLMYTTNASSKSIVSVREVTSDGLTTRKDLRR